MTQDMSNDHSKDDSQNSITFLTKDIHVIGWTDTKTQSVVVKLIHNLKPWETKKTKDEPKETNQTNKSKHLLFTLSFLLSLTSHFPWGGSSSNVSSLRGPSCKSWNLLNIWMFGMQDN